MSSKITLTLEDLGVLAQTAERNGTSHAWQAVALEWCGQANAEIERLTAERDELRAELRREHADSMQTIADCELLLAAERERWQSQCAGKRHDGCNYLAKCGSVCNKCGRAADSRSAPIP